ncbi:MAG: ABC transporter substrate-binding protein [Ruminococcus sp.]|jgi:ribose transport system substrate-binding protein|nr:ABC transporter substrate-binding protein [Ruminococcus sp.]
MKRNMVLAVLLSAAMVIGAAGCGNSGSGGTDSDGTSSGSTDSGASDSEEKDTGSGAGYKIGLTNSFNGNSYRQQMEAYAQEAADELMESGEIAEFTIVEANNDASKQVQQIENFILEGMDAIIIDPISATALTGAIQEASDAGIPCIIINDGPVESDAELCYQINFDTIDQMATLTEYVCEAIGGKGKIIELRGTAGAEFDNIAHSGVMQTLENYPDIEVVAEVYTDWTGSKAQSELASVLPTLDQVDGIVTQGGDSYAAVQAFESAGMDLPVIGGDNRGYFLKWWATEAPEGYDTLSVSSNPWDGATGVYVACDILSGEYDIPNDMVHPFAVVEKDQVQDYKDMGDEEIGTPTFDREWVRENLYQ